jgi:hypothetical protein
MLGVLARRFLHHLDTALGAVHYVTGDFRIHRHLSSASRAQTMPLRPSSWRSHPRGPDPSLLAAAFLSLAAPALPFTDCPGFTLPTVDHPSPPRAYTQGYQVESAAARAGHINPALQLLSLVLEQPGRPHYGPRPGCGRRALKPDHSTYHPSLRSFRHTLWERVPESSTATGNPDLKPSFYLKRTIPLMRGTSTSTPDTELVPVLTGTVPASSSSTTTVQSPSGIGKTTGTGLGL